MRARDFIQEYKTVSFQGIDMVFKDLGDDMIQIQAESNGRELGYVTFVQEGDTLLPQDLEVDERYRGQGIAAAMYDYVKSLGYRIRRSGQQTDAGAAFWQKHRPGQNVWETEISEAQDARTEIENMATILPGSPDEYFVRFTDQDKLGFSARQHFGRTPDIDDPGYDPLALPRPSGRPALWFYPLRTYLRGGDLFASQHPYTWLVRLRPDAWLQQVGREEKTDVPRGKTRVGMIRRDQGVPMAIFFRPGFDVVDRWYDYGKTHKQKPKKIQELADNTYLYHATYKPLLKSIQKSGLGNTTQSQWTDSRPGVVYLARDPEVARSYAETAESVPEAWLDQIVVLQISQADLDPKLLHVDRNVKDNAGDTLEYHAVIPANLLGRMK